MLQQISIETLEVIHGATGWAFRLGLIMVLFYAPKYRIKRFRAVTYAFVIFELVKLINSYSTLGMRALGVNIAFSGFRTYLFIPLLALIMCKIWKIPVLKGLDFLTPTLFFIRSVVMTGCVFLGCALAIPCEWGIYSAIQGCNVFPMDLIDALTALAVGIFSLVYAKKLNYNGNGRVFAIAMYITGIEVLFMQFGSFDSWGIRGLNEQTIYAVISIAMATVIMVYNHLRDEKDVKGTRSTSGEQDVIHPGA